MQFCHNFELPLVTGCAHLLKNGRKTAHPVDGGLAGGSAAVSTYVSLSTTVSDDSLGSGFYYRVATLISVFFI